MPELNKWLLLYATVIFVAVCYTALSWQQITHVKQRILPTTQFYKDQVISTVATH